MFFDDEGAHNALTIPARRIKGLPRLVCEQHTTVVDTRSQKLVRLRRGVLWHLARYERGQLLLRRILVSSGRDVYTGSTAV